MSTMFEVKLPDFQGLHLDVDPVNPFASVAKNVELGKFGQIDKRAGFRRVNQTRYNGAIVCIPDLQRICDYRKLLVCTGYDQLPEIDEFEGYEGGGSPFWHTHYAPIAHASADNYYPDIFAPVQFSSEGSWDPDGEIVEYLWDFGNGDTSTEANPVYTYDVAASYTVELRVYDDSGRFGREVIVIEAQFVGDLWSFSETMPWTEANPDFVRTATYGGIIWMTRSGYLYKREVDGTWRRRLLSDEFSSAVDSAEVYADANGVWLSTKVFSGRRIDKVTDIDSYTQEHWLANELDAGVLYHDGTNLRSFTRHTTQYHWYRRNPVGTWTLTNWQGAVTLNTRFPTSNWGNSEIILTAQDLGVWVQRMTHFALADSGVDASHSSSGTRVATLGTKYYFANDSDTRRIYEFDMVSGLGQTVAIPLLGGSSDARAHDVMVEDGNLLVSLATGYWGAPDVASEIVCFDGANWSSEYLGDTGNYRLSLLTDGTYAFMVNHTTGNVYRRNI